MLDRLKSTFDRVEALPEWLRPPVYGAGFVWFLIGAKGGFVLAPLIILAILLRSDQAAADIGTVLSILALATVGGAAGGMAYSLIGRWVRRAPVIGPWLAGMICVAPYMVAVTMIVRLTEGTPPLAPPDGASIFVTAVGTLIFGPLLGHILFRDDV